MKSSSEIKYCPYRVQCVSKLTSNCVLEYVDCMAYKFYELKEDGLLDKINEMEVI